MDQDSNRTGQDTYCSRYGVRTAIEDRLGHFGAGQRYSGSGQ